MAFSLANQPMWARISSMADWFDRTLSPVIKSPNCLFETLIGVQCVA